MRHVAIFGGTSAIAVEAARVMAARGDKIFLIARDKQKLAAIEADLKVRGASVVATQAADLSDPGAHARLLSDARQALGDLDVVLVAHGSLPDQKECERDFRVAAAAINLNFLSAASIAAEAANLFESQKKGCIAVISSVAGDRGRQSLYVYGSAKAGLSAFLQGLRNRLAPSGVQVLTIKPGIVDTPMTAHLKKGPLTATPDVVGAGIVKAIDKRRNVVYLPWFWWGIMTIIKLIPEAIFKRLKL